MSYPITAGDVFEAIQAGAREATLQMLKDVDFSTAQGQAQAKALLEQIEGKDFATQTTLAQILTKLADPATQTTLAAVLSKLETVSDTLTDGTQKVTLTGQTEAIPVTIDGIGDAGGALPVKQAAISAFVPRQVEAVTPTRLDTAPLANRRYIDVCMVDDNVTGYIGNADLTGVENGIPITKDAGYRLYAGDNTPIYGVGGTFLIVEVA